MTLQLLGVALVVGNGLVAGVLFGVALSTVPALATLAPGDYVRTHTLLGRNWDPVMPVLVLLSTGVAVALAVLADEAAARWLFGAAAGLLVAVAVVSHFGNVPLNRRVHRTDPGAVPPGWRDPRPTWRRRHLLRTVCAVAALGAAGAGVSLG